MDRERWSKRLKISIAILDVAIIAVGGFWLHNQARANAGIEPAPVPLVAEVRSAIAEVGWWLRSVGDKIVSWSERS